MTDWAKVTKCWKNNDVAGLVKIIDDAAADKDSGRDINEKSDGSTLLMYACLFSAPPSAVTKLLDAGADPNAADKQDMTPLMAAAMYNGAAVKPLIDAGADLDARDNVGQTALMYAVFERRTDTVKALLEAGAEPLIRDEDGRSVFDILNDAMEYTPRERAETLGILRAAEKQSIIKSRGTVEDLTDADADYEI